jgi:quercetin dioxygenase-like cupin family protein
MKKGHRCSLQFHEQKHETVYVVQGTLQLHLNGEDKVMRANDFVVIPNGQIHRMTALEDTFYLEASSPQLEDVIRVEDDYGR